MNIKGEVAEQLWCLDFPRTCLKLPATLSSTQTKVISISNRCNGSETCVETSFVNTFHSLSVLLKNMNWNWKKFCGRTENFIVWLDDDFGHCFEKTFIVSPVHVILAVVSTYYIAQARNRSQGNIDIRHPWFMIFRFVAVLALMILPIFCALLTALYLNHKLSYSDYIFNGISILSWLLHSSYVWTLKYNLSVSLRGPLSVNIVFSLTLVSTALQLYSIIHQHIMKYPQINQVEEITLYIAAFIQIIYLCTLLPKTQRYHYVNISSSAVNSLPSEVQPIASYNVYSYGGVDATELRASHAEEANCLSWLTFHWVQPLMTKGAKGNIADANDLFLLPKRLNTNTLDVEFMVASRNQGNTYVEDSEKWSSLVIESDPRVQIRQSFENPKRKRQSLLSLLNSVYGKEYYSLGILKFIADCLGFAGPILLNLLVSYVSDSSEVEYHGYIYAGGLFLSTLLASIFSTQFDYNVSVVGYKIRCAIITALYRKALNVNSVSLAKYSTGQIVNFMSTDTDRIVNFCPSFHAFWSLPFQIAVSLYLLHQQIGLAFLAGLAFAIILIPINKWLANKIGQLSKSMMEHKDSRVKIMNEVLYGIRVVKFYAWENHFTKKINIFRDGELKDLKGRKYLDALCVYFWATTPVLISILSFTTYSLLGNELTAAKVFTSLSLFLMLISPLNAFPWVLNGLVEAWVSLKRVQEFMNMTETDLERYYTQWEDPENDVALVIANGKFTWQSKSEDHSTLQNEEIESRLLSLSNINLVVEQGNFVGVIGKVGAGKSSLLCALLAEMNKSEGYVAMSGLSEGCAFVAQEPWIQHATVKDNILFGKSYNVKRYEAVLEACALLEDIKILPHGDHTEVGENGVTLSGGQKARIALARAVYQDKDIYLMDDPFAAVDCHVAQHIYDRCIMGLLKNKTVVLCTHHTKYLSAADFVVVLTDGRIIKSGSPSDILMSDEFMKDKVTSKSVDNDASYSSEQDQQSEDNELVGEEEKETGVVKLSVYKSYWKAVGSFLAPMVLFSLFLMQASRNINDWWLSYWVSNTQPSHQKNYSDLLQSSSNAALSQTITKLGSPDNKTDEQIAFYLCIYGSLAGANTLFTLFRAFLFAYGGICAAKVLHIQLLDSILKAPISFFDVTPIGRIINRFSSDLYSIDDSLPFIMNIFLAQTYGILGTIIITCYGLPWFSILLIPLAVIYYKIQNYYRHTSRELKRISSVTLSPIYAHFSESICGLSTIRAFRENGRFKRENLERLDLNQRAQFASKAASSWLGFRLQMLGVAMVTGVSFIAVLEHHFRNVDPGLVGLAISYALSVTGLLSGVVTSFTETEKQMVSVERAQQYIDTVPHEKWEGKLLPAPTWPKEGIVCFNDVSMRYRACLEYALDKISFTSKAAEKIGIVGRTGSGKSSLFLVLFRMVEIESGQVCVDNVNLKNLDLKDIRSRLAIIPQDPFLFSGSVKENLDPTDLYSEPDLWLVLERCHLKSVVQRLGGLHADVGEKGRNFSVGQRQLLCLGRALLTRAKVLCIDEATASVDLETDKLIQKTIRQEFSSSTVITIAHRINTVMDCDRVLVMDNARVAEFEPPNVLLSNVNSLFYKLVHGRE